MKKKITTLALAALSFVSAYSQQTKMKLQEHMPLTQTWDKMFALSDKVNHSKIVFHNTLGIELVADLYMPKDAKASLPAIAVSGPYGAIKEQVSGLYAQKMAEAGFLTIAFDPSYTGESGGNPRGMTSPTQAVEDFMAAVDYLSNNNYVDKNRIGILGICGWGGMGLAAATIDPRIKATVASTMYDMSRFFANGYNDENNNEAKRDEARKTLSELRTSDYKNGIYVRYKGLPAVNELPADAPEFAKNYVQYYKVRAFHPRSINSNGGWVESSAQNFINFPLLTYLPELKTPVLLLHGEKAHSLYFSQTAYQNMRGNNKELYIIKGANHIDLYDNTDIIPWKKMIDFYKKNL